MANADQLEQPWQGANVWNAWRAKEPSVRPDLNRADLSRAYLHEAELRGAYLTKANLSWANLSGADLQEAILVKTNLTNANLTGCRIYGMSAWDLKLEGAKQDSLLITEEGQPKITVDDIEVAQFVYLLLHNEKIRKVIDTIGRKAVLILGRFTPERKAALDALRDLRYPLILENVS